MKVIIVVLDGTPSQVDFLNKSKTKTKLSTLYYFNNLGKLLDLWTQYCIFGKEPNFEVGRHKSRHMELDIFDKMKINVTDTIENSIFSLPTEMYDVPLLKGVSTVEKNRRKQKLLHFK